MTAPVRSAVVNLNTLPESSGMRNSGRLAESPSESPVARSANRPAHGSSKARFIVRSANSLSLSSLGFRNANLRRQHQVFEEEAGREEREEAKQGAIMGEPIRGVSVVHQPHVSMENCVGMDVRERGRAPCRVKFTPGTKIASDTGDTQSGTASDVKVRLGFDTDDPGKANSRQLGSTRGRSEWRKDGMQSRSKSLDWRGGVVSRATVEIQDAPGPSSRRAESLERKGAKNSSLDWRDLYKDCEEVGSLSSRIQAYRAASGSEKPTPSLGVGITGTSSLRLNRVAHTLEKTGGERSLPLRLRSQDTLKSPVEGCNPWKQSSQDNSPFGGSSKPNEITGNQTIWDRIEKLYGGSGSDDSKAKRHSAPVGDWLDNLPSDSNLTQGQRKLSSDIGCSSYTIYGLSPQIPHSIEKGGTFPRRFSQSEGKSLEDCSFSESISRKDTSPTRTSLSSQYRERSVERTALYHPEVGLYTKSLDRARSRFSATAQLKHLRETETPSKELSTDTVPLHLTGAGVNKKMSLKEEKSKITMDKDGTNLRAKERMTANRGDESGCKLQPDCLDKQNMSKNSQGTLATAIRLSEANTKGFPSSLLKNRNTPAKEHSNCTEDEDVFDICVNAGKKLPMRKQDNEKAKCNNPSIDSVRNTIHKFEALAQQSQSSLQFLKSRRFFSMPEEPKDRGGLKKSESDHALGRVQKGRNTQSKAGVARSFSVDEVGLKLDNRDQSEVGLRTGTTELPSEGFKSIVDTRRDINKRRVIDEPDSSAKTLSKNTITVPGSGKSTFFQPYHKNNNNSDGRALFVGVDSATLRNISKVSDASEDDADKTPTNSPDRLPLLAPLGSGQLPSASKPHVSSTNNVRHPSDAGSEPPTPTNSIHSTHGPLHNYNQKGLTDWPPLDRLSLLDKVGDTGPFCASVARWSSDEEDDDEEDGMQNLDYDSDSGESSVTITSNMSRRSFSVSLAELCHFGGVDYSPPHDSEEDADDVPSGRSASLSSDISALSCVTLLDSEELDNLLQDVQSLGDDTLQNYNDVEVVVLHKEIGSGLGFTVAGGIDQNKAVTVHKVFLHGVASQEGSIQEGDLVLSINGTALQNSSHWEALRTLRKARGRTMAVVVLQKGITGESNKNLTDPSRGPPSAETGRQLRVTLRKRSSDLGFSLEGGVGSNLGDRPLTVQKLFHGDPVGDICAGDELLEIEGQSMTGLRRLEAWQLIKKLPPGPVEVLLRRPHKPH